MEVTFNVTFDACTNVPFLVFVPILAVNEKLTYFTKCHDKLGFPLLAKRHAHSLILTAFLSWSKTTSAKDKRFTSVL